jgi:MshEN domain
MTTAACGNPSAPVRVRVDGDPKKLRDYFLRLGAQAAIDESGAVLVAIAADDEVTLEQYLSNWTAINQIQASVERESAREKATVASVLTLHPRRPRLGEVLLDKGLITKAQLDEALTDASESGELLGRLLLRRRWLFEDELARALGEQLGIPYINIRSVGIDRNLARMLPYEIGMHYAAVPIGMIGERARIAFADPCDDSANDAVRRHFLDYDPVVAELSDIEMAWKSLVPHAFS